MWTIKPYKNEGPGLVTKSKLTSRVPGLGPRAQGPGPWALWPRAPGPWAPEPLASSSRRVYNVWKLVS